MRRPALVNVMVKAAYTAAKRLTRDFGEVEQLQVSKKGPSDFVSNNFQSDMVVILETHEGTPIGISLPDHVTLEVVETEPVVKNQTATSSYKPAVLENGVKTTVPQFVNIGDKIIVSTVDSTYTKRAD